MNPQYNKALVYALGMTPTKSVHTPDNEEFILCHNGVNLMFISADFAHEVACRINFDTISNIEVMQNGHWFKLAYKVTGNIVADVHQFFARVQEALQTEAIKF